MIFSLIFFVGFTIFQLFMLNIATYFFIESFLLVKILSSNITFYDANRAKFADESFELEYVLEATKQSYKIAKATLIDERYMSFLPFHLLCINIFKTKPLEWEWKSDETPTKFNYFFSFLDIEPLLLHQLIPLNVTLLAERRFRHDVFN